MKYTEEQLNEMQEYIISQLKSIGINHTYPKEERTLSLLLTVVDNQRVYNQLNYKEVKNGKNR